MSNAYILLTNSNTSLKKKFRVVASGYRTRREKAGIMRKTVTGKLDNQVGSVNRRWEMLIKVYETDPTDPTCSDGPTEGYGTLAHLRTFFEYNDPGGTPTNVITLTDFDGSTTYSVYLQGEMVERNMISEIEGTAAWFTVPITFVETDSL